AVLGRQMYAATPWLTERHGYEPTYKELQPDIVTLDITMPEMDGLEALKEIMKIDSSAKVVICSAMGQQGMVLDAIKGGAKDFIVKPFQADRVIEALTKVANS
ncbi:response regulator, partial [Bacillus sp. MHSD17]|nr:response regulator [Bacillus sp. MHSD17]